MPHRKNNLPDNFKAVSKSSGQVYNVSLVLYDTYLVSWDAAILGRGGAGSTYYTRNVLKEIIYKDKAWEIIEDDAPASKPRLLENIKEFCKNTGSSVTIHEKGFDVYYGMEDVAVVESEEDLIAVMDAVKLLREAGVRGS